MQPTKQEADGAYPKSAYLYHPGNDVSEWKIRVRNLHGDIDRGLLGPAHAALTVGWRGNKVDMPEAAKQTALHKLRALYHHEKMEWPDEEDDEPQAHAEAPPRRTGMPAPDDDDGNDETDDPEEDDEDEGPDEHPEEAEEEDRPTRRQQHDEPTASDVHLDATLGNDGPPEGRLDIPEPRKPRRRRAHYWNHVRDHVKQAMIERGHLKPDDLDDIFKAAHKHATAMGKKEARRDTGQTYADADEQDLNGDDSTMPGGWQPCPACKRGDDANCRCGACKSGNTESCWCDKAVGKRQMSDGVHSSSGQSFRLFLPVQCAEAPAWVNYLPRPGNYRHPKYGMISITPERNAEFVRNFSDGVYQKHIPIDAEHQTKLSGALGWVQQLRMSTDGSVDARVDWTDRGRTMLADNRFKYLSPEFYETWEQPDTGRKHRNVVIGGALTTRPFFKDGALRPLIASEAGIQVPGEDSDPVPLWAGETAGPQGGQEHMSTPIQLTEDQYTELLSFKEQAEEARKEAFQAAENARRANERAGALELERQTRIFTEEALERNIPADPYVRLVERLDPETRQLFHELVDPIIVQRNEGGLFSEIGRSDHGVSGTATDRLQAKVTQLQEKQPNLAYDAALAQVARTDPRLFTEYQEESRHPLRYR